MQSVYKFHLGLKVCKMAEEGRFFLDQPVLVRKRDLLPDTWSPLREKYPAGEVVIPLRDILAFTVSKSDNNGCDILFRMVGGTAAVEQFYHNLGYGQISVKATEEEMHKEYSAQFSNWTTPWQTVCILRDFYQGKLITGRQYDLLWEQLVKTETGSGRIKALLPPEVTVAHKTGSSGMNSQGISAATNDVGIICLPDGRHIALAVFIVESREKPDINERIIAEIARKVYDSLR
jgi:beta-lactamase class A